MTYGSGCRAGLATTILTLGSLLFSFLGLGLLLLLGCQKRAPSLGSLFLRLAPVLLGLSLGRSCGNDAHVYETHGTTQASEVPARGTRAGLGLGAAAGATTYLGDREQTWCC